MKNFIWIKALFSPFKPFKIKVYIGKTSIGVPYFLPRKWVESKTKPGYSEAIPLKIGFSYCDLGWKTKWTPTDYRHEWNPVLSFVFFGYQIALMIQPEHDSHYWESWLYYERDTNKTKSKKERIKQCRREFPNTWISHTNVNGKSIEEKIDYYKLILRKKYL